MPNRQSPFTEEDLEPLKGLPICVIMNDGGRHFGLLTGCAGNKIVLNGDAADEVPRRAGRKSAKRRSGRAVKTAAGKAGDAGLPPPGYDGWGYLGLGPLLPPSVPKIVLPIEPIEAVIVL